MILPARLLAFPKRRFFAFPNETKVVLPFVIAGANERIVFGYDCMQLGFNDFETPENWALLPLRGY